MCHFLISCPLNVYVSVPDVMQGNKENVKVNLGITLVLQFIRFYHCILPLWLNSIIQHPFWF